MSWNRIRLLIWKEFTQLRRDRSMLPILFIMPIIMLLMFGYVVGSDIKNLKLAVLDNDHSIQSRQVVDAFTSSVVLHDRRDARRRRPSSRRLSTEARRSSRSTSPRASATPSGSAARPRSAWSSTARTAGPAPVALQYSAGIISSLGAKFFPQPRGVGAGGVNVQTRIFYNPTLRAVNTMVPGAARVHPADVDDEHHGAGDREGTRARHARAALRDAHRAHRLPARQAAALRRGRGHPGDGDVHRRRRCGSGCRSTVRCS